MIDRTYRCIDPGGLHARPASVLSGLVARHGSLAHLWVEDREHDVASILEVMSAGIGSDGEFRLVLEGPDEVQLDEEIRRALIEAESPTFQDADRPAPHKSVL